MTTPFNLSLLTQAERIQFLEDVIGIFRTDALLNPLHSKLEASLSQLESKHTESLASFKPLRKSDLTQQINELDDLRDAILRFLNKQLDAYSIHWENDLQEASTRILNQVQTYGTRIYKLNYVAETATIQNLTHDLMTKNDLLADCQLLGIDGVISKLIEVNTSFHELWIRRQNLEAEKKNLRPVSELLEEETQLYNLVIQGLNAIHFMEETEDTQLLVNRHESFKEKYLSVQ